MDCRRPASVDSLNIQRHHHSQAPYPGTRHHQMLPTTANTSAVHINQKTSISPKRTNIVGWPSRDDLLHSPIGCGSIVGSESHGSFSGDNPYPSFNSMGSKGRNSIAVQQYHSLYVVLYDFHGVCEEQMTVREGDRIRILGYNSTGEWCEAQLISMKKNDKRKLNSIGWIPTSYIASLSSLEKFPWYHGKISRNDSEVLLSSGINGSFLVRESESSPGQFSITVRYDTRVYHYRINVDRNNYLYITPEAKFKTLGELIQHHSIEADGLICHLQYPAVKKQKGLTVFSLSPTRSDEWEMDRNEIVMRNQIGSGQYGDVYEGYWKTTGKTVAVKTLKEETMPIHEFLTEAAIMKDLSHPNLVSLIGICTREAPLFIITEFMNKGNLLDYLRKIEKDSLPASVMLYMASQVASGMAYLESKNIIHRDLAARNCLIANEYVVKVADFGLARFLRGDDTYTAKEGSKFPIKWCCPGGLAYNTFSTKSDVWSFGVLLWEIATYGMAPYPGVELSNVYSLLERGFRMDEPQNCPYPLYRLMLQCWNWAPTDRPSFSELYQTLQSVLQQNTLASELERSCHFGIASSRRRGSSPMSDGINLLNGNSNRVRHSINTEANRNDITTFRGSNNFNNGSSPSTRRSSTASGSMGHHQNNPHPIPPPAAAKKNALKAFLQTSVSSDDSPTTTNPSVLMYELQQKSRKIVPQFDTLPKQQRIEAFLESINQQTLCDDNESVGYGAKSDIVRATSQDSLDTTPNSTNRQSELLLQLKNRLKKTNTMENISPQNIKSDVTSQYITDKIQGQPAISSTSQFIPLAKGRNFDEIGEKMNKAKGPTPPPKIVTVENNTSKDYGENELKAKIKKLRHVETNSTQIKPTISVSPIPSISPIPEPPPRTETAKIRAIPIQKNGQSLHSRPFSIQGGEINVSNLRSASTTSSCRSSSSEELPQNVIIENKDVSSVPPKLPPKRVSLGGALTGININRKESSSSSPKQFSTLQKTNKPSGLIERFLKSSDKKVKHNGSAENVISSRQTQEISGPGTFPKSKSTRIIGEKELNLVRQKEAELKANYKKTESEEFEAAFNNMCRAHSLREIKLNPENCRNSLAGVNKNNIHIENENNELHGNPIMKSKKRYSLMNDRSTNKEIDIINPINEVSKEHLADLYKKIEDCIASFKSTTEITATIRPSTIVAAKKLLKVVDNDKNQLNQLINLNNLLLQFHSKCTIYAENISPYSKFKYNDLLKHVENINKQLKELTKDPRDGILDEMEKSLLNDCNNSLRQVMQLVNK
uniref:Tyrosine-protein kinase n=1 Tax=Strongyloides venezuelensis TaxID=75913 RepID=A0A0K0FYI6_STRVS